jgi:hypothetical protein
MNLAQAQTKKPNIIFILTDDQRAEAMGYAGIKSSKRLKWINWPAKESISKMLLSQRLFVQLVEPVF